MENTLPIDYSNVPSDNSDSKSSQSESKPRPLEPKNVKNAPRTCSGCNPSLANGVSAVACKCKKKPKVQATGLENAAVTSNTQGEIQFPRPIIHFVFVESPIVKKRRERFTFNKKQLAYLSMVFEKTQSPDTLTRDEIAAYLHIPETRIQIWFKNRRAKVRKERLGQVPISQTAMVPSTQMYYSHQPAQPNNSQGSLANYFKMNSSYGHGVQADALNLNSNSSTSSFVYPYQNNLYYLSSGITPSNSFIYPSTPNLRGYYPSMNSNTYNQNGLVNNGYNFTNGPNGYIHPYITNTQPTAMAPPNGYQYYSSMNQQPSQSISTSIRKDTFIDASAPNNRKDIPRFGTGNGSAR